MGEVVGDMTCSLTAGTGTTREMLPGQTSARRVPTYGSWFGQDQIVCLICARGCNRMEHRQSGCHTFVSIEQTLIILGPLDDSASISLR